MKAILNTVTAIILTSAVGQVSAQQAEAVTVPMNLTKYGHVYINAQLNNVKNQPMLLDTAATAGVIPNSVLEELALLEHEIETEVVHSAVSKVTLSKVNVATTNVASAQVANLPYIVQDLTVLELESGKTPGILGYGFLSTQCSILDFKNEQVTFYTDTCPTDYSKEMKSADFWLEDDLIKLNTEFNGVKVEAVLDTGAPVNIINSHLLAKLNTEKFEKDKLQGLHNKGVTHQRLGKISFKLGTHTIESDKTIFSDMPVFEKLGYKDKPVLLMGLTDFTPNKLVIDYQAKKIYF